MLTDLAATPFAEVLRRASAGRWSGDLQVRLGRAAKTVFFDHGRLVFAASNLRSDRLGETLVALGRITSGELAQASAIMAVRRGAGAGQAPGQEGAGPLRRPAGAAHRALAVPPHRRRRLLRGTTLPDPGGVHGQPLRAPSAVPGCEQHAQRGPDPCRTGEPGTAGDPGRLRPLPLLGTEVLVGRARHTGALSRAGQDPGARAEGWHRPQQPAPHRLRLVRFRHPRGRRQGLRSDHPARGPDGNGHLPPVTHTTATGSVGARSRAAGGEPGAGQVGAAEPGELVPRGEDGSPRGSRQGDRGEDGALPFAPGCRRRRSAPQGGHRDHPRAGLRPPAASTPVPGRAPPRVPRDRRISPSRPPTWGSTRRIGWHSSWWRPGLR